MSGHTWLVQTAERQVVPEQQDGTVFYPLSWLQQFHPCPMPLAEADFLVKHLTQPGQLCLDYFCGLGAVGLSCAWQGRRFLMGDIEKRFCQIANWRLLDRWKTIAATKMFRLVDSGDLSPERAMEVEKVIQACGDLKALVKSARAIRKLAKSKSVIREDDRYVGFFDFEDRDD